jgi:XTP/dITP diphosphohydrolase
MGSALLVATRNVGKRREFEALLAGLDLELVDLAAFPDAPEVPEEHATYEANARDKALTLARHCGVPALADDSGLEVDALGGAPGVRSARFAGAAGTDADNVALLLQRLRGVPEAQRAARFRCAVVVARPDGRTLVAHGSCEGRIAHAPRGTGGFGYDPVFLYLPARCSFAELAPALKNQVSHRAAACQDLRLRLRAFLAAR